MIDDNKKKNRFEDEEFGEFVNVMKFEIPMRLPWLDGNPSIRLEPGRSIVGPVSILRKYNFLAPVPMAMHEVSSVITNQDGSYQDVSFDSNEVIGYEDVSETEEDIENNDEVDVETVEEYTYTEDGHEEYLENEEVITQSDQETSEYDLSKLPFDLDNVNWLMLSSSDLEDAARKIGMDLTPYLEIKSKSTRRWELVKGIKEVAKSVKNDK